MKSDGLQSGSLRLRGEIFMWFGTIFTTLPFMRHVLDSGCVFVGLHRILGYEWILLDCLWFMIGASVHIYGFITWEAGHVIEMEQVRSLTWWRKGMYRERKIWLISIVIFALSYFMYCLSYMYLKPYSRLRYVMS